METASDRTFPSVELYLKSITFKKQDKEDIYDCMLKCTFHDRWAFSA